jgi:hypothetical protein
MRIMTIQIGTFLIVFSSLFAGCITKENNTNDSNEKLTYTYKIEILTNNSTDYHLNVPLPLFGRDQPSFSPNDTIAQTVIDNIKIPLGDIYYQIISTPHGKALNLSFDKCTSFISDGNIKWRDQFSKEPAPLYLSMIADCQKPNWIVVSEKYWVYSSRVNMSLKIKLDTSNSQGGHTNFNSEWIELKEGWQIVDIQESIEVP